MNSIAARGCSPDPWLTVVVVTLVGGLALERCLSQIARFPARRMVVARPDLVARHAASWPQFEWCATTDSVPMRRAHGLASATTPWVAIIEDTCVPADTWFDAAADIAADGRGAAWSGPVAIAGELAPRFMALACTEYAEFTPDNWVRLAIGPGHGSARRMSRIPGLNLLYRRNALVGCSLAAGLFESDLHPELQLKGEELQLHPGLGVTYWAADPANASIHARRAHGRIYGGGVAAGRPMRSRLVGAARCLALPAVLALRASRGLPQSYRARLAATAWIFVFSCAWACGEFVGLLAGRGNSPAAWA